jgi:hypothetical protein
MLSNLKRWLFWGAGAVCVAGVVVLVILGVRWLAYRQPAQLVDTNVNLEAEWDNTIRHLGVGIEPVYPPEEDLAVGDLFATVVADDKKYLIYSRNLDVASTPFLGKSVRVGHVDVSKELNEAYAGIPLFPETPSAQVDVTKQQDGQNRTTPVMAASLFGQHEERRGLPRAAFPGLTIYQSSAASAGATATSRGWFDFSADNETSVKLVLGVVETYGLDVVTADKALTKYCDKPETALVCTEDTVRKHLRALVGDHVLDKFVDPVAHDYRYAVTVQLVMVNRVYLARTITQQSNRSQAEGGGASVGPRAASAASTEPVALSETTSSQLESRLSRIEKQLGELQTGLAAVYRLSAGAQTGLDGTFPRPLAIGYRSIPYSFKTVSGDKPK